MSIKTAPYALALATTLQLAACAAQSASSAQDARPPRRCFLPSQVNGWRSAGNQTVYVGVSVNRVFRMTLMGSCPNIDWSQTIGIEHRGAAQICSGLDATIIAPSRIGRQRCPVTSVQELTPDEIAALPRNLRP